jgi:hypothetical protein
MRWNEIISEKFRQALPVRARADSNIKKASPLIPAQAPIDPLASIMQQVAGAKQPAQDPQAVAAALQQQGTQESMKDREKARDIIKKKYAAK